MLYQSLKYFLSRIGLSFFLLLVLGFAVLYFMHEMTFTHEPFDDTAIQWVLLFISVFFGFFAYGMVGEQRFQNAFHALKNVGSQSDEEEVIGRFDSLMAFTRSSYFLPGEGRRFRGILVRKYADYLLSAGRRDPKAMRIYLKAFLQNPKKSKFREPLLAIFGQGVDLEEQEIDLLLVMLKAENYQDDIITNHLASVFLKKEIFTGKTEPLFLAAVESGSAEAEQIIQFVVPILLAHKRSDATALGLYLHSLPYHLPGEEGARDIIARSFCEGHWQGIDPVLHEKCGQLFYALAPERQQQLQEEVENSRISGRLKKVKLFRREDLRELERLKLRLGIIRSGNQILWDGIAWVGGLFKGWGRFLLLKAIDGLVAFSKTSLRVRLITFAVLFAYVLIGLGIWEWYGKKDGTGKTPGVSQVIQSLPKAQGAQEKNRIHTLQVAAVTSSKKADRLMRSLKKKGVKELYVVKSKRQSGGNWYKIRSGRFASKQEALNYADGLIDKKAIQNYFIISFPKPSSPTG